MKKQILLSAASALLIAAMVTQADPVTTMIYIGDDANFTQLGDGNSPTESSGLVAEAENMWGITASVNRTGIYYATYSNLVDGSLLPSTIQAGTYTFSARVGFNTVRSNPGLNDISLGTSTGKGMVAGFFTTVASNAQDSKNNMFTEFNSVDGVTYTQPTDTDLVATEWSTWNFTWEVAEDSSVIGKDFNFGVYVKSGQGGGSGFFDDSTLSFVAIPEPAALGLIAMFGGGLLFIRRKLAV